jgi:hypothetical protein
MATQTISFPDMVVSQLDQLSVLQEFYYEVLPQSSASPALFSIATTGCIVKFIKGNGGFSFIISNPKNGKRIHTGFNNRLDHMIENFVESLPTPVLDDYELVRDAMFGSFEDFPHVKETYCTPSSGGKQWKFYLQVGSILNIHKSGSVWTGELTTLEPALINFTRKKFLNVGDLTDWAAHIYEPHHNLGEQRTWILANN